MLKLSELKEGDLITVNYDGHIKDAQVVNVNMMDKQVCVDTADGQEFWYDMDKVAPLELNEAQLFKLGFTKQINDDGSIKYSKGAFRILLHGEEKFSDYEIWYREDRRHINQPIFVHDLQNKYYSMTKVYLTKGE